MLLLQAQLPNASQLTLSPVAQEAIVAVVIVVGLFVAWDRGWLEILGIRLSPKDKARGSSTQYLLSELIPNHLLIGNSTVRIFKIQDIKSLEDGTVKRRFYFYDSNGEEDFRDSEKGRYGVESDEPDFIEGRDILWYITEPGSLSKKDLEIELWKGKYRTERNNVISLKAQLKEYEQSDEAKEAREKMKRGAAASSQTFSGAGARYDNDDEYMPGMTDSKLL